MSDIIDFNELKNKAKDKDVDKFEEYIYSLYYSMSRGEISMGDLARKIQEYMKSNDISEEKFYNIQKKLLDRYGYDVDSLSKQMKDAGYDFKALGINNGDSYEAIRKTISFHDKYKGKLTTKPYTVYKIKNTLNDVEIYLSDEEVIIKSNGKIELKDVELNEFLVSYKKVIEDKSLKITLCENTSIYVY